MRAKESLGGSEGPDRGRSGDEVHVEGGHRRSLGCGQARCPGGLGPLPRRLVRVDGASRMLVLPRKSGVADARRFRGGTGSRLLADSGEGRGRRRRSAPPARRPFHVKRLRVAVGPVLTGAAPHSATVPSCRGVWLHYPASTSFVGALHGAGAAHALTTRVRSGSSSQCSGPCAAVPTCAAPAARAGLRGVLRRLGLGCAGCSGCSGCAGCSRCAACFAGCVGPDAA